MYNLYLFKNEVSRIEVCDFCGKEIQKHRGKKVSTIAPVAKVKFFSCCKHCRGILDGRK